MRSSYQQLTSHTFMPLTPLVLGSDLSKLSRRIRREAWCIRCRSGKRLLSFIVSMLQHGDLLM